MTKIGNHPAVGLPQCKQPDLIGKEKVAWEATGSGCLLSEELGQGYLGLHESKSLAHADTCALSKGHPAARHMPVQALLLCAALHPALWDEVRWLSKVLFVPLQCEDGHLTELRRISTTCNLTWDRHYLEGLERDIWALESPF